MRIAITGGIGSGKSYVCRQLSKQGIRVYDCDKAAKRLMQSSPELQRALTELVGKEVFPGGELDKDVLRRFLMASDENAQKVDDVVHPVVAEDFLQSDYEWMESAILFDSGFDKRIHFDYIICVTAPLEVRIERIMKRDGISREKAMEWINRQMPQEEKARRSDYVIENDGRPLSVALRHLPLSGRTNTPEGAKNIAK